MKYRIVLDLDLRKMLLMFYTVNYDIQLTVFQNTFNTFCFLDAKVFNPK